MPLEDNMIRIQIDDMAYEVQEGRNLLETCLSLGINLPYFCYHPALGSVGACRQCAVKKFASADDKTGRLIMACMEPVADGMIISVKNTEASDFRASVIEGLMTNHPHDCPVCDEGGECHLQDMTVMTGHNYRRYRFKKRTHLNQDLGPFIHHEMNRCIQCYRCVRFYRDYAGGGDLNVFGAANRVYFGRESSGRLESEFSGNLVEVCPTGVFTDKTLKQHYVRKWDLTHAPSVCVHCSLGCNTLMGERYGTVRRVMNRYNGDVNGHFLCDRGRFGYEYIHHPARIKKHLVRQSDGNLSEGELSGDKLKKGKIIGIGSPRASLESNFALMKLTGRENFFHGIPAAEYKLIKKALELMENSAVHLPSLRETQMSDAIFILGEDVTQTTPVLALSLRQAIRNKSLEVTKNMGIPGWNDAASREIAQDIKTPLYIAHTHSTKLDDAASLTWHGAPGEIASLGFAVAHQLNAAAPKPPSVTDAVQQQVDQIAAGLSAAEKPLIIAGVRAGNEAVFNAASNIITALAASGKKPWIMFTFSESNSVGLGMMDGGHLEEALEKMAGNEADTVIILENDLYTRAPSRLIDPVFKNRRVIVIDHLMHHTAASAMEVFPASTVAESSGTLVNNEGRAQRYYPVLTNEEDIKDSWRWIAWLMSRTEGFEQEGIWNKFDELVISLAHYYPSFAAVKNHLPHAALRYYNEKIARQTFRFSGRTAINAHITVHEPAPPLDVDSPLKFSMEGYKGTPPSGLIPFYWSPGWNSPQAVHKYLDEPGGSLKDDDPGIRLLGGKVSTLPEYLSDFPERMSPVSAEYLFVPAFTLFGSEELSAFAKTIAGIIPDSFVLLNSRGIAGIGEQESMMIQIGDDTCKVHILKDDKLPDGMAALAMLFNGMPIFTLPAKGRFMPMDKKPENQP